MEERHIFQSNQQTWIQPQSRDFHNHGGRPKQGYSREEKIVGRACGTRNVYLIPKCVQGQNVVFGYLLYLKVLKTFMVFPLYLYFKPIEQIQFAIVLRTFPSIGIDFSFHTQIFSCMLYIFFHFDHLCLIIVSKTIYMGFLCYHYWSKFEKRVLKKSQNHQKVSDYRIQ